MALMLRSQGIPTRLVSGYRGAEWDSSDGAYTVLGRMAHLWVEVWFPGEGWVIFDPSPQNDVSPHGFDAFMAALSKNMLRARMFWYQEVIGFQGRVQLGRLRERTASFVSDLRGQSNGTRDAKAKGTRQRNPFMVPVMLSVTVLALWFAFRGKTRRRKRRLSLTPDQQRAVRLYERFRQILAKRGAACDGQTAEELAQALQDRQWVDVATGMEVLTLYNETRFGCRPLSEERFAKVMLSLRTLKPNP